MGHLSKKEVDILRFIRRSRHKTTVREIARGLSLTPEEVEVFVRGMAAEELIHRVQGTTSDEDSYYTSPEKREEIYELLG